MEFGASDEDMHRRRELMQGVTRDRIMVDAAAMLEHAAGNDKADSEGKIGAVGFCMSGPLVLGLAQRMPDKVRAIASVHGAWVVTDKEDSPHLDIDNIKAEVYFAWAEDDPTATEEEMHIMDKAMTKADINYRIDYMRGAVHGFAPRGERYNHDASERHWERVHDLFRRNLG